MSTRATIKYRRATDERSGFHLFDDLAEDDEMVFLQLDNPRIELCADGDSSSVTIGIPREMAKELGLLREGD